MARGSCFPDKTANRFPLLPRTRPACKALRARVGEIRDLAHAASQATDDARMSLAAGAHNKAALIVSDCGLVALARQLCWRQFETFQAAAPLNANTAQLALQPVVNLGRLLTRSGDCAGAYQIFENVYEAARSRTDTEIDGRTIAFPGFLNQGEDHRKIRQWLWAVLLADGTRALVSAGQWEKALAQARRHNGIGTRLLDGRQVAILTRSMAGDGDGAIGILEDSTTPTQWEKAVAACMKALCLRMVGQPTGSCAAAMVREYLKLEPTQRHVVFRTRLGLCVVDLASGDRKAEAPKAADRVIREALAAADAYAASAVLSHETCRSNLAEADHRALTKIVEASGLRRGTMPPELLDDLVASVRKSEAQLRLVLTRNSHRHS